jgi:hypothetical protein
MSTVGSLDRQRAMRCSCFRHARHLRSRRHGRVRRFLGSRSCKVLVSRWSCMCGRSNRFLQYHNSLLHLPPYSAANKKKFCCMSVHWRLSDICSFILIFFFVLPTFINALFE